MKRSYLHLLCDPVTREDLILTDAVYDGDEIVSGMLVSPSNRYPIKNGIPRFVNDEGYSDNFGYQWNRWARVQFEDRNVGGPMQGHTEQMFRKSTGFTEGKLRGRTVLDMGCGPGRFSDVASTMGARVVALDYSSAIDVAKANFKGKDSDILFVQGDCLRMPFKDGSIDYAFTIGVLHHTPSPATGVQEAHRVVKVGGEFAIRVYRAGGFYVLPSVRFWRSVFQGLKPLFGHYPPPCVLLCLRIASLLPWEDLETAGISAEACHSHGLASRLPLVHTRHFRCCSHHPPERAHHGGDRVMATKVWIHGVETDHAEHFHSR